MIELRWLQEPDGKRVLQYRGITTAWDAPHIIYGAWQTVPVVREERLTGATKSVGCGGDERRKESVTPYVEKRRPQRLPVFRDTVFTADEDALVERRKGERRVAPFNIEASLELNRRHCDDRRAEKPTGAQETVVISRFFDPLSGVTPAQDEVVSDPRAWRKDHSHN